MSISNLLPRIPDDNFELKIPFAHTSTWKDILELYPHLEKELDGSCMENWFLFYYEYSPVSCTYLFKDEDSENDIAEIFGIDLYNISTGETFTEELSRKDNEIRIKSLEDFINCSDIDEKNNKNETKLAKKERRRLKLLERNK